MGSNFGYSTFYGDKTALLEKIDATIVSHIQDFKLNYWNIPTIIDGKVLERCGYFCSLPNQLTKLSVIRRDRLPSLSTLGRAPLEVDFDSGNSSYLTPAACIHFYPMLEESPVFNEVITTRARVYRYEDGAFDSLSRQWDFTVREMVAVGTREYTKNFLNTMEERLFTYANSLFKNVTVREAHDHFYPSRINKVRERYQVSNNLKRELIVDVEGRDLAIASFNYHDYHFSKEFNFDDNGRVVTGCVGCGLERWIKALEVSGR